MYGPKYVSVIHFLWGSAGVPADHASKGKRMDTLEQLQIQKYH
jgi:hypothetical protein